MSKVFIKVCGQVASGKTFVGVIIEKALIEAGFNVRTFDNMDEDASTKSQWLAEGKLPINTQAIEIEIDEVQLHRSSMNE